MTATDMRASQSGEARRVGLPGWAGPWRQLAVGVAAVEIISSLIIQVFLAKAVIPPLVILAVLLAAGILLVVRRPTARWPGRALCVIELVFFAGDAPHTMPELAHPGGGSPFVVALAVLLAGILAAVTLVALVTRLAPAAPAAPARLAVAAALVVVAGAVVGTVATLGSTDDAAAAGDVEVSVHQVAFQPRHLEVRPGPASFHVKNRDPIRHTFTIDGRVDVEISPGKARRVSVSLAPGTYTYHCTVPGHGDMKGTLTVR